MPGNCLYCNKEDAKASCGGCKSVFYCDRECQIKHWNKHKLECKKIATQKHDFKEKEKENVKLEMDNFTFSLPLFNDKLIRIEESSISGYGMIANCNIKRGTIICSEKAMLILPDYAKEKQKMKFYIKQQFLLLSQTQKNIYKSLSSQKNNDNDDNDDDNNNDDIKLLNIWLNNQIEIKQRRASGIFPLISRVNHSCISNAHWIWNEKYNEQRLIALNDINKNNEIFVNYCSEEPMQLNKRKNELKTKWDIDCKCDWCHNDKISNKIEKIINEYETLDKSLESLISNPLNGYKTSQKLIKIVEKHFNSNPKLMSEHCLNSGQFALGLQKWSEASYYLETHIKEKQIAQGNDIQIQQNILEKVNLLPTKFRSRFRKFDPKYNRNNKNNKNNKNSKNNKNNKNNNNDDTKSNENLKQTSKPKGNQTKNGKKSNGKGLKGKSNGKTNNRNNKNRNNKNKKKKTKK